MSHPIWLNGLCSRPLLRKELHAALLSLFDHEAAAETGKKEIEAMWEAFRSQEEEEKGTAWDKEIYFHLATTRERRLITTTSNRVVWYPERPRRAM